MSDKKPFDVAMDIMRLAKLPPGYEPAILPVGFVDAMKEFLDTSGCLPAEQGDYKSGYSERGYNNMVAYMKARKQINDFNLLRCLAPCEWARSKSHIEELREFIRGDEEE
jgi:hypothetical protein